MITNYSIITMEKEQLRPVCPASFPGKTGKEPIYLSDYSRNEINSLRGESVEMDHAYYNRTYLYGTKAYICDVMSGLLELIDTPSDEDRELYQRTLSVLCDYRRLIDELSKVEV